MSDQVVSHRYGHVAVTWKESTIIWGGRSVKKFCDPSLVSCHLYGKWFNKKTTGDVPSHSFYALASVIDDTMVVMGGWPIDLGPDYSGIYSLDLNTSVWTRLIEQGTKPPSTHRGNSCLVYKGNIHIFGGFNLTSLKDFTTLYHYNITTNQWGHIFTEGDIPTKRAYHKTILFGDKVFLFGGCVGGHKIYNDLYILDMLVFRWKLVHGPLSGDDYNDVVPRGRWLHTMTCINQSTAVVHGGFNKLAGPEEVESAGLGDTWVLDLNKAIQLSMIHL